MKKKNVISIQCLLFLIAVRTLAGVSISPTSLELSDSSLIGEFTLENKEAEPKLFEASIKKWTQKDNEDVFAPTDDLIILPMSASLAQNKKQKFRVIVRKPAPAKSQVNYRLSFSQMPKSNKLNVSGISFLLNINVPIVLNGKELDAALVPEWFMNQTPSKNSGEVCVKNKGNGKFVITSLMVFEKSKIQIDGMHPVLPSATKCWQTPIKQPKGDVKITYKVHDKEQNFTIKNAVKSFKEK